MRRLAALIALAVALVVLPAAGAFADELADYLEAAEQADYSGRQLVVTIVEGSTTAEIYDVDHGGGVMMVDDDTIVGAGSVRDESVGVEVSEWNSDTMGPRYSTADPTPVMRLGRDAVQIDVFEDELLRARMVFDTESSAPMMTQVFDGSGQVFRWSSMLDFSPTASPTMKTMGRDAEVEILMTSATVDLPQSAAGYLRQDAYVGPNDGVHAFYSDGLFSFSVFDLSGDVDVDEFDTAPRFEANGYEYHRLVTPSDMWVKWERGDHTYLLVGDLPPDHLEDVLTELPRPQGLNFFQRMWKG
ncbi:MAG: hypothetical protein HKO87_01060, partial [Acidimicrobiia bacterium]|nr:hypothetical protein [Acidimicrobiia bacterium]